MHIDKPKKLQDYRQVQYNKWCRYKHVYNGSYLPKNPELLTTAGKKGWYEIKGNKNKQNRNFIRKNSGQKVRFDQKYDQIDHYHWIVPDEERKRLKNKKIEYYDRYGKPCTKKEDRRHLAPLDKDCPKLALRRNMYEQR